MAVGGRAGVQAGQGELTPCHALRSLAVVPDEIRKPIADVPDLGAVQLELLAVCVLTFANFADEDEAFEVQDEVVELPEL
jgi:hypothetical protein